MGPRLFGIIYMYNPWPYNPWIWCTMAIVRRVLRRGRAGRHARRGRSDGGGEGHGIKLRGAGGWRRCALDRRCHRG
jgi:hypothetical protein